MYRFLFILCIILITYSCEKDESSLDKFTLVSEVKVSNISKKGVLFKSQLNSLKNEKISDYGFLWSEYEYLTLGNAEKKSLGHSNPPKKEFSFLLDHSLKANTIYHVSAYVIAGDKRVIGNPITFISLGSKAPQINSFYPHKGHVGDTLVIKGKRFSSVSNKVYFQDDALSISYQSDSLIKAVFNITPKQRIAPLTLHVADQKITSKDEFELLKPEFTDFSPTSGWFESLIWLKIKHTTNEPEIFLGNTKCDIITKKTDSIKVKIPFIKSNEPLNFRLVDIGVEVLSPTKFQFTPPVFKRLDKEDVVWDDTLTIVGKNFNFNEKDQLKLKSRDYYNLEILQINDTSIKIIVPDYLYASNKITATYKTHPIFENQDIAFKLRSPEIESISPLKGVIGDTISLVINNLKIMQFSNDNSVYFGNERAQIISFNPPNVKIIVPDNTPNYPVKIKIQHWGNTAYSDDNFELFPLILEDFQPKTAQRGDTIQITGQNFSSSRYQNVSISGISTQIIDKTKTSFKAILQKSSFYSTAPIKVQFGSQEKQFTEPLTIDEPWKKLSSYDSDKPVNGITFTIDGKLFFGLSRNYAANKLIWCYHPDEDRWERKNDFPMALKETMVFKYEGKVFAGLGRDDTNEYNSKIWEYNSNTDTWSFFCEIDEIKSSWKGCGYAFNLNDEIFIGFSSKFCQLDMKTKEVTLKSDFPGYWGKGSIYFSINGEGYFAPGYLGNYPLYRYDPSNDNWDGATRIPGQLGAHPASFELNGKCYIIDFGYGVMNVYDPIKDIWTSPLGPYFRTGGGLALPLGDKIYYLDTYGKTIYSTIITE